MIKPYFGEIRDILVDRLSNAKYDVYIAVAWITDKVFEDIILKLLEKGVVVDIIIVNDDINRNGNVNWGALIKNGANIFYDSHHHKFCVIDRKVVITGSFNWTYAASNRINRENIIIIENESDLIEQFSHEFMVLKRESEKQILEQKKVIEHIIIEKQVEKIVKENITSIRKYKAYRSERNISCGKCSGFLKLIDEDKSTKFSFSQLLPVDFKKSIPKHLKFKAALYCENCGSYFDEKLDYL
jgi:phosphatidylserine/phosphatidylglycerophosphate/cardiolipin synthase-like enzyme